MPVPKQGDLSVCDNWRRISLPDVIGKVVACILQERLQEVVEEQVTDSQCYLRKGRGRVDMLFCARQLVEKAYEHNSNTFLLFIDLHKAYDSIPRQAMWKVLAEYNIPTVMINLLRSLHECMVGQVIVGSNRTQ